jgi:hypothetical protein
LVILDGIEAAGMEMEFSGGIGIVDTEMEFFAVAEEDCENGILFDRLEAGILADLDFERELGLVFHERGSLKMNSFCLD